MKKLFRNLITVLFILIIAMTTSTAVAGDLTKHDFMTAAKQNIVEVSVSDAKALLDKGGYLFLDVRTSKEFKISHIPGAMHLARGLLELKIAKKVPDKDVDIIIYCKSGDQGSLATYTLCQMGYKNVKNMTGGWKAWRKEGRPLVIYGVCCFENYYPHF